MTWGWTCCSRRPVAASIELSTQKGTHTGPCRPPPCAGEREAEIGACGKVRALPGASQPRAVGSKLCPLPSLRFWHLPPAARPQPVPPPPSGFPACRWHGGHAGHLFHLLRNNGRHYGPRVERVPAPPGHKKPQSRRRRGQAGGRRGAGRGLSPVAAAPGLAAGARSRCPRGRAVAARGLPSEGQRWGVIPAVEGPGRMGVQPGPEAEPWTQDKSYFFVSSKSGESPGLTKSIQIYIMYIYIISRGSWVVRGPKGLGELTGSEWGKASPCPAQAGGAGQGACGQSRERAGQR